MALEADRSIFPTLRPTQPLIATMSEPLSFCAAEVRRDDHDRFLTGLFAPAANRAGLYALYAFNLEVAKIRERVSEAILGEIRLQWWREALDGIAAGAPPAHPVVDALDRAIGQYNLSRSLFDRLLAARAFDLDDAPPATLDALEAYAEDTSATLHAGDTLVARSSGIFITIAHERFTELRDEFQDRQVAEG